MEQEQADQSALNKISHSKVLSLKLLAAKKVIDFDSCEPTNRLYTLSDFFGSYAFYPELEKYVKEKIVRGKWHILQTINNPQKEKLVEHVHQVKYSENNKYALCSQSEDAQIDTLTLVHFPTKRAITLDDLKYFDSRTLFDIDKISFTSDSQKLIIPVHHAQHNNIYGTKWYTISLKTREIVPIYFTDHYSDIRLKDVTDDTLVICKRKYDYHTPSTDDGTNLRSKKDFLIKTEYSQTEPKYMGTNADKDRFIFDQYGCITIYNKMNELVFQDTRETSKSSTLRNKDIVFSYGAVPIFPHPKGVINCEQSMLVIDATKNHTMNIKNLTIEGPFDLLSSGIKLLPINKKNLLGILIDDPECTNKRICRFSLLNTKTGQNKPMHIPNLNYRNIIKLLYSSKEHTAEYLYTHKDSLYHSLSDKPLITGLLGALKMVSDDRLAFVDKNRSLNCISLYTALAKKASAQNLLELLIAERQMQEGKVIDPKIIARLMRSPSKRLREVTKERYEINDIRKKLLPSASFAIASKEYPRAFTPPVFTLKNVNEFTGN